MNRFIIKASKSYQEKQAAVESELKAPRRIILWVIVGQVVEIGLLIYLVMS